MKNDEVDDWDMELRRKVDSWGVYMWPQLASETYGAEGLRWDQGRLHRQSYVVGEDDLLAEARHVVVCGAGIKLGK